jgi:outer membrane immunogenic protein
MIRGCFLCAGIIGFGVAAAAADELCCLVPEVRATPAPVVAPIANWSGCYLGAVAGYAWGRDANNEIQLSNGAASVFSPTAPATPNGAKLGGLLGCNRQFSQEMVFGIEVDGEWANLSGTANYINTQIPPDFYQSSTNMEGSVRGRIGYAFNDVLLFATGGIAFAGITERYVTNVPSNPGVSSTTSSTRIGWSIGGGIDYMVTSNWIARAEFGYSDFGIISQTSALYPMFSEKHTITENSIRMGIAYKFGNLTQQKY